MNSPLLCDRRILFRADFLVWLAGAAALLASPRAIAASIFDTVPASLRSLGMNSQDNLLTQPHVWVNSGGLSVNPELEEVAGLGDIVAPPWTTGGHRLAITFDGATVKPQNNLWLPGEFQRRARLASGVEIRTLVSPVFDQRGLVEWIEFTNPSKADHRVAVAISSQGRFGKVEDKLWTFGSVTRLKQLPDLRLAALQPGWAQSLAGDDAFVVGCTLAEAHSRDGAIGGELDVPAGRAVSFAVVVALGGQAEARALAQGVAARPQETITANRSRWAKAIADLYAHVPRLTSSNHALVAFYNRSLLSYPLARWDLPELAAHPWYATCGMDGGALCAYVWDYTYSSRLNALATPESDRDLIRLFLRTDLTQGYAILPFSAKIFGAHYSYNDYSIIRLIYYYVLLTGDRAFLNESINGRTVWEHAYDRAIYRDDLTRPPELIDYGTNYNLLEMKRTEDYTHFVPSPNAERCWSYRAVDEMAGWAGRPSPGLTSRAAALAQVISARLWSPADRWLTSLDLKGNPHLGYSIQVFDVLRSDILSREERDGLVSHLNEREFLSPDGVHSYSKATAAYDVNARVDWGGPGVYAGDAPELVSDLMHCGYPRQADDVLSRILWWGQSLPYYPQAIRADYKGYRRDGRANVLSGSTAADTIVFSLLGVQVSIDGEVTINPHLPSFVRDLGFVGVEIRRHRFDVGLDDTGYHVRVEGGKRIDSPYGKITNIP